MGCQIVVVVGSERVSAYQRSTENNFDERPISGVQ